MAERHNTFLLGLRSLLFYVGYVSSLVIHSTVSVCIGPFLNIRQRFRFFLLWNRFLNWWLRITCGVKVRITGMENVPPAPYVILSNHQSTWETLYFIFHFMPLSAILKKELLNIPFFGWGLRMLQPIAIDRGRKRQARDILMQQGRQRIADGISVLIFPEGTRRPLGEMKAFSGGGTQLAIDAGVKVLPVAHDAGKCWPPHTWLKYPGTVNVMIGPALESRDRSARELTREAESWIREALGYGTEAQAGEKSSSASV